MKANEVILKDQNLSKAESLELILNILNKRIDYLTMSHLSKWERDNTISEDETRKKVEALKAKRNEINGLLENLVQGEDDTLDISLMLEVKSSAKKLNPVEMVAMH